MYQLSAIILAEIGGLILLPFFLCAFAFWIWMMVDCAKYKNEVGAKIVWLLVIFLFGIFGAPLYFLVRRMPRQKFLRFRPAGLVYQPWQKDQRID